MDEAAKGIGLQVNEEKTKVFVTTRKTRRAMQKIPFENYFFEEVQDFKYLGSVISMDNDETKDVQERIKAANRT